MREIIFRGKRVENGEWVYGMPIWDESHPDPMRMIVANIEKYPHGNNWEVIHETVGQYTGLKDKHGKMIFEGDIFTSDYFKDGEKFEVVFRYGAFCGESNRTGLFPLGFTNDYYETGDDDDDFYYPEDYTSHIQIIGNIHDQKEDV